MPQKVLHEFFAVTVGRSIYEVSDRMLEGCPVVQKITGDQVRSPYIIIGGLLQNGHLVGITEFGICLFDHHPKYGNEIDQINSRYWGGTTSGIVALFLTESEARHCLEVSDLNSFDARFLEQTKGVLEAISEEHPVFQVSDSLRFAITMVTLKRI